MASIRFFLFLLFLPALLIFLLGWMIYWKLYGKNQAKKEQKRQEQKKKLLTHIKNFSPARLKNRYWQNISKKRKKKQKKPVKHTKNKQK